MMSMAKDESQKHALHPSNKDTQSQATQSGFRAQASDHPLDAASNAPQQKSDSRGSGNKENIGFVDQVGGQSGSAQHFQEKDKKS